MSTIIGVAGGIASGKSLVTEMLCRLGAVRLDADQAGHEVLTEPEVIAKLRSRWGDGILSVADDKGADDAPSIDRRAVARIVFAAPPTGPRELAFLEGVSHPRITSKLEAAIAAAQASEATGQKPASALVLDAAVMFRAGWGRYCDWLLFVEAPTDVRLARAVSRGWTVDEFRRREAVQEPMEWKLQQADVMIENTAEPSATFAQVRAFWKARFARPMNSFRSLPVAVSSGRIDTAAKNGLYYSHLLASHPMGQVAPTLVPSLPI